LNPAELRLHASVGKFKTFFISVGENKIFVSKFKPFQKLMNFCVFDQDLQHETIQLLPACHFIADVCQLPDFKNRPPSKIRTGLKTKG
jgi:hypothetical protein